jgi:chromosome segregation ATPase
VSQLTIEEQRQLGLTDEQIQKIADKRRDLEREREKIEAELQAARAAARAANAEASRIQKELNLFTTDRLEEVFKSVMTEEQLKKWNQQRLHERAEQWLKRHSYGLKLTDAQSDDISLLLVPVLEKLEKLQDELGDARKRLAELRRADKVDIKAVEKAEKAVAELGKRTGYRPREDALLEAMRAGLMAEQIEKLNRRYRYRGR